MDRLAETGTPISDLIARRWSHSQFDPERSINEDELWSLLEAARWAPSCFNEQPWRYLVFDKSDPDALRRAHDCLAEGNTWAKQAPLLLLAIARETFTRNNKPNRHHAYDVGAASISLALQATLMGLSAHQMAGFDAAKAQQEFQIPDGYVALAMIAVGYPVSDDSLSDEMKTRLAQPRSRRPLSDIASRGSWDTTLT